MILNIKIKIYFICVNYRYIYIIDVNILVYLMRLDFIRVIVLVDEYIWWYVIIIWWYFYFDEIMRICNICIFLYVLYIIVYVLFFNFFVKIKLESFGIMMVIFFVVDGFFEVGWDILLLFFYFFFVKIKFYNIWLFVNIWNYGRDIIRCSCIL